MRVILACGIVALALGGCSKSESGGDSSGPVKREAGSWKSSMTLDKFEMPGMAPEMKTGMEKMMNAAAAVEVCLTPEQAAKEDMADAMTKAQNGKDCTYSKKDVSGGSIAIEAVCKDGRGQNVNLSITGKVEPKKTDMVITIDGAAPTGQKMNMAMHAISERTGDCKPGQASMPAQ